MTDNIKKDDKDLEDFLQGKSELSSLYKEASNEQTSGVMDSLVLDLAKKGANGYSINVVSPFSGNWKVPLSLAAVLVLSVTVILKMENSGLKGADSVKKAPVRHQDIKTRPASETGEPEKNIATDMVSEYAPAAPERVEDEMELAVAKTEAIMQEIADEIVPVPGAMMDSMSEASRINDDEGGIAREKSEQSLESTVDYTPPPTVLSRKSMSQLEEKGAEKKLQRSRIRNLEAPLPERRFAKEIEELDVLVDRSDGISATLQVKRPPGEWLKAIKRQWLAGDEDGALAELIHFRDSYPKISDEKLQESLGRSVFLSIKEKQQLSE